MRAVRWGEIPAYAGMTVMGRVRAVRWGEIPAQAGMTGNSCLRGHGRDRRFSAKDNVMTLGRCESRRVVLL